MRNIVNFTEDEMDWLRNGEDSVFFVYLKN